MVNMLDPRQNVLFDTFKGFLSPLAYKTLTSGWQGVFRHVILEVLPAPEIANHFNRIFGRPTKELYSIAGLLLIKEFMDWTEEEAANAYMFNADVQYALNLGRDNISMSTRTIQRYEQIFREDDYASGIMTEVTNKLISELDLDISKQRLDSTHIFSDMATFARTRLMGIAIKRFLTQLKRHNPEGYNSLPENVLNRYRKSQGGLFGEVASDKESRSMLRQEVAEEMYFLIMTFSGVKDVENRTTYKDLVTIFHQQCSLVEPSQKIHEESGPAAGSKNDHDTIEPPSPKPNDGEVGDSSQAKNNGEKTLCDLEKTPSPLVSDKEESPNKAKVEVKKNTGGRVIQNPSDPDATYSGHKGAGYQAQIAETCSGANEVQLITYALPETACESDSAAVVPAMDKLEKEQLLPDKMLADTLYGSDENVLDCERRGVELISPTSGNPPKEPPKNPLEKQQRLATRREQEKTEDWREEYKIRAGIEATNSALKRKTGLNRLRVRGKKSVFNVILLKITGWNILRASSSEKMKEKIAKLVEKSNEDQVILRDLKIFRLNTSLQRSFPTLSQPLAA